MSAPTSAPTRSDREYCWLSRDSYYSCLDNNAGDIEKCAKERGDFKNKCSNTWVKYFDKLRVVNRYKKAIEEGKDPSVQ